MIDTIQIDLDVDGIMSIDAHKMYFVKPDYGEADMPIVAAIKNGINKLGWLSLPEERIKDAYGISADGKNYLSIRFVVYEEGGWQAETTAYNTSRNQTLEIDLRDFEKLNLKDENGDVGRSKGDYADRVLGHECFMQFVMISMVLLRRWICLCGSKKDLQNYFMVEKIVM